MRAGNRYADAHADSECHRMQSVGERLPGWKRVHLLLRNLGVHAALPSLLCASLFRTDTATDSNAVTQRDTGGMRSARTRLPVRDNLRLLLRDMGMPAARYHLLRDRLCFSNIAPDADANTRSTAMRGRLQR